MNKGWIIVLIMLISCGKEEASTSLKPVDFKTKLAATPGAVLLDVRSAEEVRQECIPGQLNFDFNTEGFKTLMLGMDKSKPYFVYCAKGVRSNKAADLMRRMDFTNVYTLEGGLEAWKAAGLPIKTH
jgi:rhodanese-related sulfurtransferase